MQKQQVAESNMLKRNAIFLIEASERIDYDQEILRQMKDAFNRTEYTDVIDLAYIHDRAKRAHKRCNCSNPASDYANEVISELSTESQEDNTPSQLCVSAIRFLSKDLTYDNREAAKHEIRKAIRMLS